MLTPAARRMRLQMVNLDPAAEHFKYPVTIDVRDLISLEDVMEETEFGPNGGTFFFFFFTLVPPMHHAPPKFATAPLSLLTRPLESLAHPAP